MKVLVIDDDPATTDMLEILLSAFPCTVLTANSGADGIHMAHAEEPSIILLDVMMEDMDGLETCKALRKFTNVPILMLSALNTPEMTARALDLGADDYLTKPVPSNMLFAHMNSLLRRSQICSPEYVPAGAHI